MHFLAPLVMCYRIGKSHISPCDLGALDVCMTRPPKRSRTWTTQEGVTRGERVPKRGRCNSLQGEVLERIVWYKIVFHIRVQVGYFNKYPCANLRGCVGKY